MLLFHSLSSVLSAWAALRGAHSAPLCRAIRVCVARGPTAPPENGADINCPAPAPRNACVRWHCVRNSQMHLDKMASYIFPVGPVLSCKCCECHKKPYTDWRVPFLMWSQEDSYRTERRYIAEDHPLLETHISHLLLLCIFVQLRNYRAVWLPSSLITLHA